jgi:hypothetical protein
MSLACPSPLCCHSLPSFIASVIGGVCSQSRSALSSACDSCWRSASGGSCAAGRRLRRLAGCSTASYTGSSTVTSGVALRQRQVSWRPECSHLPARYCADCHAVPLLHTRPWLQVRRELSVGRPTLGGEASLAIEGGSRRLDTCEARESCDYEQLRDDFKRCCRYRFWDRRRNCRILGGRTCGYYGLRLGG